MKPIKLGLRIWIAFTAAVSFLAGWAMLAHSGKPAPLQAVTGSAGGSQTQSGSLVLPTLPPVPSLNDLSSSAPVQNLQPLQIQPAPFSSSALPPMMTRGS